MSFCNFSVLCVDEIADFSFEIVDFSLEIVLVAHDVSRRPRVKARSFIVELLDIQIVLQEVADDAHRNDVRTRHAVGLHGGGERFAKQLEVAPYVLFRERDLCRFLDVFERGPNLLDDSTGTKRFISKLNKIAPASRRAYSLIL